MSSLMGIGRQGQESIFDTFHGLALLPLSWQQDREGKQALISFPPHLSPP